MSVFTYLKSTNIVALYFLKTLLVFDRCFPQRQKKKMKDEIFPKLMIDLQ